MRTPERLFVTCLALASAFLSANATAQDFACDPQTVELRGAEIFVSPGSDDRNSLQCALNEAVRLGVQKIKLDRGIFTLDDTVGALNFQGQVEGTTRSDTVVRVNGFYGFVFQGGSPSLKFMTVEDVSSADSIGVAFLSNSSNCNQRTVFAEVDRVDFSSNDSGDDSIAIVAIAEPACPGNLPLLGKLTVNRSTTDGFAAGVFTQMAGGASITVSNNTFDNALYCAFMSEANADASFIGNQCTFDIAGFLSSNVNGQVPANRVRVQENRFATGATRSEFVNSCLQVSSGSATRVTMSATSNQCTIENSEASAGIIAQGIDGAVITGNTLRGSTDGILMQASDGGFISANVFQNTALVADIRIDENSDGTIVAPQSAVIEDLGTGSYLLE